VALVTALGRGAARRREEEALVAIRTGALATLEWRRERACMSFIWCFVA
jgi:hypothetical protein